MTLHQEYQGRAKIILVVNIPSEFISRKTELLHNLHRVKIKFKAIERRVVSRSNKEKYFKRSV